MTATWPSASQAYAQRLSEGEQEPEAASWVDIPRLASSETAVGLRAPAAA